MQYLICEKKNNLVAVISDEIIANEQDPSLFYDVTGDGYYSTSDYVYYEFPNDDIPKYIREFDYRYTPEEGFSRAWTMEEIKAQRIAISRIANMKTDKIIEVETMVNAILGIEE